ncbi:hypothetical protein ACHAPS_007386 [Verticillium nonalfalfae]
MPQTTTCPVSVSTSTVTSVTTVTSIATDPTVAGPPGSSNVPNALFESGDGSGDWCRNVDQSPCRIVRTSADGSFSGLFGAGMLYVSLDNEAFRNFAVAVPVTLYPNPAGRDWRLTASFRAASGNPGGCGPILGWTSDEAGYGLQPGSIAGGLWRSFSVTLPQSANGRAGVCSGLYIDGVAVH